MYFVDKKTGKKLKVLSLMSNAIYYNEDNTYRFSKKDFDELWDVVAKSKGERNEKL